MSVTATAEGSGQPVQGELPNENAPEKEISPLPPFFSGTDTTVEAGQFLTVTGGWVVTTSLEDQKELLNSTKQTFTFEDQEFVLSEFDDWENNGDGSVRFSHTDPPYPRGSTVEVSWDAVVTDTFYDEFRKRTWESGERLLPSIFPTSRTYEIVGKDRN